MKDSYVKKYTGPLRKYLYTYSSNLIHSAWQYRKNITVCGISVKGDICPQMYSYFLLIYGTYEVGNDCGKWQGCLPLDNYKKACTYFSLPQIN